MEVIYTSDQLQSKCSEWQRKLRLQDWDVQATIERQRNMIGKTVNGQCEYNERLKAAFIRILDPVDYDDYEPEDMERILVHELVHLWFAPFWDDEKEHLMEQGVEQIARALIGISRRSEDACLKK